MKSRIIYLLCLVTILISSSCQNNEDLTIFESQYLIFGRFYGECLGDDCVQTFKIMDEQLYADQFADYSHKEFSFKLTDAKPSAEVLDLLKTFPSELLAENDTILGCPDCADQGGLYIETIFQGQKRFWRIDQFDDAIPSYLQSYKAKVNNVIVNLNRQNE